MTEAFSSVTAAEASNIARANIPAVEQYVRKSIEFEFPDSADANLGWTNRKVKDANKFGHLLNAEELKELC